MNMLWIAALAILVLIEKTPSGRPPDQQSDRPIALIVGGTIVLFAIVRPVVGRRQECYHVPVLAGCSAVRRGDLG